jgi:MYXO-CTERM domain-containing protein
MRGYGWWVGVVGCSLLLHESRAPACTPPHYPDAGAPEGPQLGRSVSPASGTTVPTNVVVRVGYGFKYFAEPNGIGAIGARIVGGAELDAQVTLVDEHDVTNPFGSEFLVDHIRLYEVRIPSLPPGATFELLDRFDAPCDPCIERDPAPFAMFTAGAGPDTEPPVLDPAGGVIVDRGYQELFNSCTYTVCKGSFAGWSWNPATDDGGAVWYQVTFGDTRLRVWMAQPEIPNAVSICQDCGQFGPSIYWDKFALKVGMTVRAVDNAGNVSAAAVVISELPPCGFPPDAGPPDVPIPPDAPPPPDAPLPAGPDAPPANTSSPGSGCSVPGSSSSAPPWALALLVAARRRRRRDGGSV